MTLHYDTKRKLDAFQRFTLRSAARIPKLTDEDMISYRRRANGIISCFGYTPWSHLLEAKKFRFAGHVVRHVQVTSAGIDFSGSLAAEVVHWRSLDAWRNQQCSTNWHYLRVGRPTRWESELHAWSLRRHNTSWLEIARSCTKDQWNAHARDYVRHLGDSYQSRHVKLDLHLCSRCGNVHDRFRRCWQGPSGNSDQWCFFTLPSGHNARAIQQQVEATYDMGQLVFRSDGAAPAHSHGGSLSAAWASVYFVVDGGDLVPCEQSFSFLGRATNIQAEAHGVFGQFN